MAEKLAFRDVVSANSLLVATSIKVHEAPESLELFWELFLANNSRVKSSEGLIEYAYRASRPEYFTLSAWESEAAMLIFRNSARHQAAMDARDKIGRVVTAHWYAEIPTNPSWEEVRERLSGQS